VLKDLGRVEGQLEKITQKKKDREEQRSKAQLRLQTINESVKMAETTTQELRARLEREKNDVTNISATRVALDMKMTTKCEDSRQVTCVGRIFAKTETLWQVTKGPETQGKYSRYRPTGPTAVTGENTRSVESNGSNTEWE